MAPTERSLEEVIQERAFAGLLQTQSQTFFRLSNSLVARDHRGWSKRHLNQLISESDSLESFLDDYGARYNRTYSLLRELVASLRWFASSAFSLAHLSSRFESYNLDGLVSVTELDEVREAIEGSREFLLGMLGRLLETTRAEADKLGLERTPELYPDNDLEALSPRKRLPRNVGQEVSDDEGQRISEVASKYLASCELLEGLGIRRIASPDERMQVLGRICTEARARVYEATVHNLQSTYDTFIKNTVIEGRDDRLPRLRGHMSTALHLLEAVTFLTHFVERHESGVRSEAAEQEIGKLIDRAEVQAVILNQLLFEGNRLMQLGRGLAEELLHAYTNLQELVVDLPDDLKLHARPASLIVGIVGHHGTPVELEVDGHKCNAGSILELLVTVGSHPEAARYVFRGDENPLRDIGLLFETGLGEDGLEGLPSSLGYLRG